MKQDRHCTYNAALQRVRVITVAVEGHQFLVSFPSDIDVPENIT